MNDRGICAAFKLRRSPITLFRYAIAERDGSQVLDKFYSRNLLVPGLMERLCEEIPQVFIPPESVARSRGLYTDATVLQEPPLLLFTSY